MILMKTLPFEKRRTKRYWIGIDTGTNTGLGIWDRKEGRLIRVETLKIHRAMEVVKEYASDEVAVRVEDARARVWFGESGREKLQGAGSIKRDAVIWEDFLNELGVDYEMVAPRRNVTKLSAEAFKRMTGYEGRTSEHGRDAAMLVFKM